MHSQTTFRRIPQTTPPSLSRLVQRAKLLRSIALAIREFLPGSLANHCQPGNISDYTLSIYVNSPAWATRLRFFSPELIKFLQTRFRAVDIRHIRIAVKPGSVEQSALDSELHYSISQENAQVLLQAAATAHSPRLSAALRRLAKHALTQTRGKSNSSDCR